VLAIKCQDTHNSEVFDTQAPTNMRNTGETRVKDEARIFAA